MAPRVNKRQQRELEELETLAGHSNINSTDEEETVSLSKGKSGASGFTALLAAEDNVEGEEEEEDEHLKSRSSKSKKSKRKKKVPAVEDKPDATIKSSGSGTSIQPLPKNEKKAAKKAKAKARKSGMDEIDAALEALSIKHPEFKRNLAESSSNSVARSLTSLLAVNPTHLDSDVELKRFFGSKVVAANKDKPGGNSKRAHVSQRSVLTKPQATWAPAHMREGLSARQLTEEEVVEKLTRNRWDTNAASEKWWTVEYSKKYKGITMLFLQTVLSGDPQGFYNILQGAPWHADSWLQLAEVFRHREEHSSAVDAVDRAMFAYERAFVGGFSFTNGTNRLDFDRVENRPFFLALHRQASDLQRRGCMRTAFEFAKLLYSLDPWGDPHGAVLHLDFLALKAGMSQWLLDVFALFESNFVEKSSTSPQKSLRVDPSVLPGWAYAKALALKLSDKEGGESAGTAALIEAADSFPSVVPLLADKLDVMLSASIRGHRDFRIETDCRSISTPVAILHLLSHIYVQRSFSLWKDPKVINWFTETMSSHFSSLPSSLPPTTRRNRFLSLYAEKENTAALSFAVYRHIIVLETSLSFRSLFPFIPNSVLNSNSGNLACDPLPPPDKVRVSEYGETFFAGVDKDEGLFGFGTRRRMTRRERELEERRLARMIPDVNERRQVQAIFENNAHIQQRFPGGIVQFAQAMELLPPDALEDMFAAAAIGAEQDNGDRGMPGQMPGLDDFFFGGADNNGAREAFNDRPIGEEDAREDEDEEDDDEENEDEDEDIAPMPVRVIRNLLGRLWGAGANVNVDDSTDSDEEEIGGALRDHGGVD
ncbi:transcriptional repressor TCF25-domain-containing protein [Lentinula edodes]|uniref:transcriptional repressor TCF25-domain-containing protein n=1 Tax=Lentinula edodes TaxID=5353 RepID=UPI001E8D39D7|nr:transcriptional repressor TCF25-domain-containing protein [Lentinula edodes]KAH7880601.1 transcriptional repressor TCF25-domain-containing protein [Lentinula edodes]